MDKIKQEIQWALACAKSAPGSERKDLWLHQAFGALQYHLRLFPEHQAELEKWWNEEVKPDFEIAIYGCSLTYQNARWR